MVMVMVIGTVVDDIVADVAVVITICYLMMLSFVRGG